MLEELLLIKGEYRYGGSIEKKGNVGYIEETSERRCNGN